MSSTERAVQLSEETGLPAEACRAIVRYQETGLTPAQGGMFVAAEAVEDIQYWKRVWMRLAFDPLRPAEPHPLLMYDPVLDEDLPDDEEEAQKVRASRLRASAAHRGEVAKVQVILRQLRSDFLAATRDIYAYASVKRMEKVAMERMRDTPMDAFVEEIVSADHARGKKNRREVRSMKQQVEDLLSEA